MKLQIKVGEDGIIQDVKFKTFGCGSAIASSSYMTERVLGMSLEQAGAIKNTEIAKELCLPPVKLHCSSTFRSPSSHPALLPAPTHSPFRPVPANRPRSPRTQLTPLPSSVLAEDAIKAAIKDYQSKRAARTAAIDVSAVGAQAAQASSAAH